MKKHSKRQVEAVLYGIYREHCQGQINVLDIGDVWKAGEAAYRSAASDQQREAAARTAMTEAFTRLRKD